MMVRKSDALGDREPTSPLVGCGGVTAPSASSSSHRRPGGGDDRATPDYRTCQARICCQARHLTLASGLENDVPGTRRERRPTTMWQKRCGRSLVHYQPTPRFLMVHSATGESKHDGERGVKMVGNDIRVREIPRVSTQILWEKNSLRIFPDLSNIFV